MKARSLADSFRYASRGLIYSLMIQRNMKIHILMALLVLAAGFYFRISHLEWLILLLAIALVMTAEIINTSIECAVDLVTREREPLARKAKDTAAGAVLLAASFSIIMGLIVFLPRIINLFAAS